MIVRIDFHAHWLAPGLADLLRQRHEPPFIRRGPGGEQFVGCHGTRPFDPTLGDLETRRTRLRQDGIDRQVLSLSSLFGIDTLPAHEAMPLVTVFNRETLDAQRSWPDAFAALAALPMADLALACETLEAACRAGMHGAIVPAEPFRTLESAMGLVPLLATAQRLRCHLFLHPSPLVQSRQAAAGSIDDDTARIRRTVLAVQARLSEVMITLEATDLLEAYPDVSIQVGNLGGSLPFLRERIAALYPEPGPAAPLPSVQPWRCHVDTASFGPRAIAMAAACYGAERLLLGSDSPMFDGAAAVHALDDAGLPVPALHAIAGGNAARLLGQASARSQPPASRPSMASG